MKIHEYQAKELLAAAGAAIPRGIVVGSPDAAQKAFDDLGGKPVVLKAQVHAGGRGKGRFKDSGKDFGGVKFVTKRADVAPIAEVMLKHTLVTKQTGADGQKVSKILVVDAKQKIVREVYAGMVLDRTIGLPVLMACAEGGVEIEEVAAKTPDKILKTPVNPEAGLQPFQARRMAYALGFTGLGVGASRFGGRVMLDLLGGQPTELTELNLVRSKPIPFPPEPLAYLAVQATRWSLARADRHQGRRNLFLRALDAAGLGFGS